jgi:glutamate--cysteine ligase
MKSQILNSTNNTSSPVITELKKLLKSRGDEVNEWFNKISRNAAPFFYNSVDLRHFGYKLAPVDTNLFPAGFNNLHDSEKKRASLVTKEFFAKYYPQTSKVLIIAENHTRNNYYLENISVLAQIIKNAGFEVKISSIAASLEATPLIVTTDSGNNFQLENLVKSNNIISTRDGFTPDFILLNNDMTDGAPSLFQDTTQTISPPVEFGWHMRRKSAHFEAYNLCHRSVAYFNLFCALWSS